MLATAKGDKDLQQKFALSTVFSSDVLAAENHSVRTSERCTLHGNRVKGVEASIENCFKNLGPTRAAPNRGSPDLLNTLKPIREARQISISMETAVILPRVK